MTAEGDGTRGQENASRSHPFTPTPVWPKGKMDKGGGTACMCTRGQGGCLKTVDTWNTELHCVSTGHMSQYCQLLTAAEATTPTGRTDGVLRARSSREKLPPWNLPPGVSLSELRVHGQHQGPHPDSPGPVAGRASPPSTASQGHLGLRPWGRGSSPEGRPPRRLSQGSGLAESSRLHTRREQGPAHQGPRVTEERATLVLTREGDWNQSRPFGLKQTNITQKRK